MKISIKVQHAREFAKIVPEFEDYVSSRLHFQRDEDEAVIDITFLNLGELNSLYEFLIKKYNKGADQSVNGAIQILTTYIKIKENPDIVKPTNLRDLEPALKEYIGKNSKAKYLFAVVDGDVRLPYLVTGISYEPAKPSSGGYVSPAHTNISIKFIYLDAVKSKTITFYDESLRATGSDGRKTKKAGGLSVSELLEAKGYIIGDDSMCINYEKELEIFFNYRDKIGEQFTSTGSGKPLGDRYSSSLTAFNTDGSAHKLVVDEPSSRKFTDEEYVGGGFWDKNKDEIIRVPVHPFIRVFNLKTHLSYSAHTSKMTPYAYRPDLIHKLHLPQEVKDLVEILGKGVGMGLGDIISGKAEGIIVGCVGAPGLGKSLTAEIYSEFLKRPLYTVQCSQLGTDPDTLEKRLNEVLYRASRWKAVLLLDEADVYIRARGTDILQNAIVGVFLRVIEYYQGIIFMTSNVLNLDDAIESRFSAKITYPHPDAEAATKIWKDQIVNHGWKLNAGMEKMVEKMVKENPQFSGRSIRSLLKLSTLLAWKQAELSGKEPELTMDLLKHASRFVVHEKPQTQE